jgi:galactokinase
MDSAQIYSSTLEQLNKTVVKLTSPEWDAKVQAPREERRQALAELPRVQHARSVLANAAFQEIAKELKANEQNLLDGQNVLQGELDKLTTIESCS